MSGEEEKAPEVAEVTSCPFCDGEMAKISSVDTREGTEIVRQCKTCGFRATFIKGA